MEQTPQQPELNLYIETGTSRIYEGKLFENYVILRPVLPAFHNHIRKVDLNSFGKEFVDFTGDRNEVRTFLQGYFQPHDITIN